MLTFSVGVSASEGMFDGVLLAGRVSQLDEVANGTVGGYGVTDAAVMFMHEVCRDFVMLNDRHMLVAIIASINSDLGDHAGCCRMRGGDE